MLISILLTAGTAGATPQPTDPIPGPNPADETPPDDEWSERANALVQQLCPAVVLIQQFDEEGFGGWHGSGFLISEDGYIVTVAHNVEYAATLAILLYGETFNFLPASVIVSEPEKDVALIKIEGANFPYVEFGDSDTLQTDDMLMAIGHPGAPC
ncbi:MAG: trypsin-like peptidase domain-containing protein [Chloroflexi bacterium]|nr:trypsin-like peptidase domain-containing protein [Chloroflexota bacterium]